VNFQAPRQRSPNGYLRERIIELWAEPHCKTIVEICEILGVEESPVRKYIRRASRNGDPRVTRRVRAPVARKKIYHKIGRPRPETQDRPHRKFVPRGERMEGVPLLCAGFGIEKIERLVPTGGQVLDTGEAFARISVPRVRWLENK
jgi:hypothetical protein